MKTVNARWLAFKYKLAKKLNASIENDKNAIKEGAKITFENYCKIQKVECSRKSYSKEIQQELEEYAKSKGYEKQETKYIRIDIDDIPNETDTQVEQAFNTLENSNNILIAKVANRVNMAK